jgi:hypothetical protein
MRTKIIYQGATMGENMATRAKTTLSILICAAVLLNAGGCVFVDHDHYHHDHHDDAIVVHP